MGTLALNKRERRRLEVLSRVRDGELTLVKAAELLDVCYRQAKRMYAGYREEGDEALAHGLRGKPSNRGGSPEQREAVLAIYQAKYAGFGPTLAAEYLAREDRQPIAVSTLRRWLLAAGLWKASKSPAVHRQRRPRKEHAGEMLQLDGSHHDWFEGRRPWAVLMVAVDDATNETYAQFFEGETTAAAMTIFWRYTLRYGLPRMLYVDRDSIYEPQREATGEEILAGLAPQTQFGRAMQELGVKVQCAHSPQAKGRVERRNGVLQDRLVKALRLHGVSDLDAANRFLEATFLPEFNARFRVRAKEPADLHQRVPDDVPLEVVLAIHETRVVQNDWTVLWHRRVFQLTAANQKLALVKQRVTVCEQLDGRLRLLYQGRELEWRELPPETKRGSAATESSEEVLGADACDAATTPLKGTGRVGRRPSASHPWRKRAKPEAVAEVELATT